ncbi:hypothetical protein D3C81_2316070 [compost metagenome]
MPLKLWGGEQGQRLRRAQARHERMVTKACLDHNVSSHRLNQLIKRYDRILLAAVKLIPR